MTYRCGDTAPPRTTEQQRLNHHEVSNIMRLANTLSAATGWDGKLSAATDLRRYLTSLKSSKVGE